MTTINSVTNPIIPLPTGIKTTIPELTNKYPPTTAVNSNPTAGTGIGITAIDKLVFDATVEVTRADGAQIIVSFQFYFRHYEGMQDVIKNSEGKYLPLLLLTLLRFFFLASPVQKSYSFLYVFHFFDLLV